MEIDQSYFLLVYSSSQEVANHRDIVSSLPFLSLFSSFYHNNDIMLSETRPAKRYKSDSEHEMVQLKKAVDNITWL